MFWPGQQTDGYTRNVRSDVNIERENTFRLWYRVFHYYSNEVLEACMPADDPVSVWMRALEKSEPDAATNLWNHFCQRITGLARNHLDAHTRRVYDENDAANSAFHSLCKGIQAGRFSDLKDRDNLWRLLTVITARKVSQQKRAAYRDKRGGGQVRGDSVFQKTNPQSGFGGIDDVAGREPTPEFAVAVAESCEALLNLLTDETLRTTAIWKFENHTNGEIAEKLQCTRRTVERKLELIRRIWCQSEGIEKTP